MRYFEKSLDFQIWNGYLTFTMDVSDKISKLIRLAGQHDNANEAAAAFGQAQRLATLHGLDLDGILETVAATETEAAPATPRSVEGIETRVIVTWNKVVLWKLRLVNTLARANNSKSCYLKGWDGYCAAYGQPSDLDTIAYLFDAITHDINRLAKTAIKQYCGPSPKKYGRSFRLGCVDEISRRLRSSRKVIAETRSEVDDARALAFQASDEGALAVATTALARVCAAEDYQERVTAAVQCYEDEKYNFKAQKGSSQGFAPASGGGYVDGRNAGADVYLGGSSKALNA